MNAAIGIGALLLGGWVFNAPADYEPSNAVDQAPAAQSGAPANMAPSREMLPREVVEQQKRNRRQPQTRTTETPNLDARGLRSGQKSSQTNSQTSAQAAGQTPVRRVLPALPTDPLRANTPGSPMMPLPPTVNEADLAPGAPAGPADPFGNPSAPVIPDVPTSRQAYAPRTAFSRSPYSESDDSRQRSLTSSHPAFVPQGSPTKALASARPFSSGVSPYMQLFRNDTAGGTIDNYSTFVRPALDQRSMNQQFNMDIYGLERSNRLQNAALQQMGRGNISRAPQSIGTPQFYMNYGRYYPGYGQGGYGQQ